MVRDKGTRGRAAGNGLQHRRFYFKEALAVQKSPDFADNSGTLDKRIPHFRVYNQIQISLTVAQFLVFQTVEFFRQYLQAFGEQDDFLCVYRNFARFCLEYKAFNTNDVTNVKFFECGICFIADIIAAYIGLHVSVSVLNIAEGRFTHDPFAHQTPRDGNVLFLQRVKIRTDFIAVVCYVIPHNLEGVMSFFLHLRQLLPTNFVLLAQFLASQFLHFSVFLCHVFLLRFVKKGVRRLGGLDPCQTPPAVIL